MILIDFLNTPLLANTPCYIFAYISISADFKPIKHYFIQSWGSKV